MDLPKSPEGSGANLDAFVLSHAGTLNNPVTVAEKINRTLAEVSLICAPFWHCSLPS